MEYLHHGDLAEYIQTNPVGAHTNARALTMQLLRGLDILHKRKICHRDLKPPVHIPSPHLLSPFPHLSHLLTTPSVCVWIRI